MTTINIYVRDENDSISVRSENWSTTEVDQSKAEQRINWLADQRNHGNRRSGVETRMAGWPDDFVTFYGDYGIAV